MLTVKNWKHRLCVVVKHLYWAVDGTSAGEDGERESGELTEVNRAVTDRREEEEEEEWYWGSK